MTEQHVVRFVNNTRFARVCRPASVPQDAGYCFDMDFAHVVAVFCVDGVMHAVSNICPHKHMSVICNGHVEKGTVRCPMHGWTYSIATGAPIVGASSLRTYKCIEMDGWVWVEWPDDEVPRWAQ